jgi:hypothetical protein
MPVVKNRKENDPENESTGSVENLLRTPAGRGIVSP